MPDGTQELLMPVYARLQAEVGEFLGLKAQLLGARGRATTPEQRATVETLLARQIELEGALPPALQAAQRLSSGQIGFGDAATAATFYAQMHSHLGRARTALEGLPAPARTEVNWGRVLVLAGILGGGLLVARAGGRAMLWVGLGVGGYLVWRGWAAGPQGATP